MFIYKYTTYLYFILMEKLDSYKIITTLKAVIVLKVSGLWDDKWQKSN